MDKLPFQVLRVFFIIRNEFAVLLKQIKRCYRGLSVRLGHFWKSYCCVYYKSRISELICALQNLVDIVEQKREK